MDYLRMDPLLLLFQMGMIVIGLMGLNNGMKLIMVDYFGKYCHSNDVFFFFLNENFNSCNLRH